MKIKPCLFLTSLCALLCQTGSVDAQEQPRFGFGSTPRGAYVIPAPKTVPRPVVSVSSKSKTAPTAAGAKSASKKAKPGTKTLAKSGTGKTAPSKTVASTKAKPTVKPSPKALVAKAPSKSTPGKPTPAKAVASSRSNKTASSSPGNVRTAVAARSAKPRPASNPVKAPNARTSPASALLAEVAPPASATGFHFFGAPVILPEISHRTTTTASSSDPRHFVDLMAARHALTPDRAAPPAPRKSPPAPPEIPQLDAAPRINPKPLASRDFQTTGRPLPPALEAPLSLDEPAAARTLPVILALATSSGTGEPALESTLLDEPALPDPVISLAAAPAPAAVASVTEAPLSIESEPALPSETPPAAPQTPSSAPLPHPASKMAEALSEEQDLSERERAFVRSLAAAAGSVTSASGQLNNDLPTTIATAATAMMDQVPAETVASFRSVAASVKESVQDMIPDLPMEISNDLMPATPEKMPDRLPAFNAPASGKIDVQSDRQADYDQANNKVIFTGKVELNSAAIRLRAERVEVFMKKGGGGMERVEATGNVLMRTQATESGPGQMASAGRASYNLKTGEITLSDWPKIQETGKSHISTDPSTRMYMFTDGRLRTDGPNRTILGGN